MAEPVLCVTCDTDLLERGGDDLFVRIPMPTLCGGDFRTLMPEAAEEIVALARARFPHAEIGAIHSDAPAAYRDRRGAYVLADRVRVGGYACSFDCLEAFAVRWEPFAAAVRGHFRRSLVRGD